MDGSYQVSIIPGHRSSQSPDLRDLFTETMLLYCGAGHPVWRITPPDWDSLRSYRLRGWALPLAQHGAEPPRRTDPRRHRV